MSKKYPNAGKPYPDDVIDEVYVFSEQDDYRDPDRLERAADHYGRTPGALEMNMRWGQGADFPPKAQNRVGRQMKAAKSSLRHTGTTTAAWSASTAARSKIPRDSVARRPQPERSTASGSRCCRNVEMTGASAARVVGTVPPSAKTGA